MATDETIQAIEALPNNETIYLENYADTEPPQGVYEIDSTTEHLKALADELKLYREFVGAMMMIQMKDDVVFEVDVHENGSGKWHVCDERGLLTLPEYDSAIDAWRNMRNIKLSEVESKDA